MNEYTYIWAWRFSVGYGWRWVRERRCLQSDSEAWYNVFSNDEPDIHFIVSNNKPKFKGNSQNDYL